MTTMLGVQGSALLVLVLLLLTGGLTAALYAATRNSARQTRRSR